MTAYALRRKKKKGESTSELHGGSIYCYTHTHTHRLHLGTFYINCVVIVM